ALVNIWDNLSRIFRDKGGYKYSLTHEAETCLLLQQGMQITIEDVEWQFSMAEDAKLVCNLCELCVLCGSNHYI
ncbi:MAG: hypothetical protein ACI4Q3_10525, partial [Kiritimatiellia bacterium]